MPIGCEREPMALGSTIIEVLLMGAILPSIQICTASTVVSGPSLED